MQNTELIILWLKYDISNGFPTEYNGVFTWFNRLSNRSSDWVTHLPNECLL